MRVHRGPVKDRSITSVHSARCRTVKRLERATRTPGVRAPPDGGGKVHHAVTGGRCARDSAGVPPRDFRFGCLDDAHARSAATS